MKANTLGLMQNTEVLQCPEKGCGAGEGSGTQVLLGLAEKSGGVEPGENEAQEGPLPLPTTT